MFCVIVFVNLLSLTIILESNILYCLLTIDKYIQCNELKLKYNHKSDMQLSFEKINVGLILSYVTHKKISNSVIDNIRIPNKAFSLVEENLNKCETAQNEKAKADA